MARLCRRSVFRCTDGRLQICELNCDTPSGLAEATVLGPAAGVPAARDPNAGLAGRFGALLRPLPARSCGPEPAGSPSGSSTPPSARDLGLIRLYERWARARGFEVVLGSPFNLQPTAEGGVALFGKPCDLVLRHYKTDWWGERLPIWDDEDDYPDPDPLAGPLRILLRAALAGRCAIVNPLGAVLPQNKRAMAFLWEERDRFSPSSQRTIDAFIPRSLRLESCNRQQLVAERARWVLKSDYGCEGDEVLVGALCDDAEWTAALERALPGRWMVQQHFDSRRDALGREANHGVYVIAGEPAGIYTRLSSGPTSVDALSVPTLVRVGVHHHE